MSRQSHRLRWSARAPVVWRRRPPWCRISVTLLVGCALRHSVVLRRAWLPASKRRCSVQKAAIPRHEVGYYIRLLAVDKPGTAATIAKRLAQQNISLESIVQRHRGEPPHGGDVAGSSAEPVPVILITYATTEDAVRKALAAVGRDKVILGKPRVIRIEKN